MANVRVRASEEGEKAQDSSAYRTAQEEEAGILGKIVANLPDGRKESAPESYDAKPQSRTLEVGVACQVHSFRSVCSFRSFPFPFIPDSSTRMNVI